MRIARQLAALALAISLIAACGSGQAQPRPTTCGGNHVWPPPHYPGPTPLIAAEVYAGNLVRVRNLSDGAWTVRVAPWVENDCVGWVAQGNTEGSRVPLPGRGVIDRTVTIEGEWPARIGIELWDHACDDGCTDPLDAFLWLYPVTASFAPLEPTPPGSLEPIARDELFELELAVAQTTYPPDSPINALATLRYLGPDAAITTSGSGSGPILFGIEQLDGPLDMLGAQTADCGPFEVHRDAPLVLAFRKTGGYSADDPRADFWKDFFADPELRLPAGTWRLWAIFERWTGGSCGAGCRRHALLAAVTITVR